MRKTILLILVISLIILSGCKIKFAECEKIKDPFSRDFCYTDKAVEQKNIKICDSINDFSEKEACYSDIARETKDPSICENKITKASEQDWCYGSVGIAMNDRTYCDKINDDGLKDICYQQTD